MTIGEMLDSLDAAIATGSPLRPNKIALELVGISKVLGEHGRPVDQPDGTRAYGFTRPQCIRMRDQILAAARADAGAGR